MRVVLFNLYLAQGGVYGRLRVVPYKKDHRICYECVWLARRAVIDVAHCIACLPHGIGWTSEYLQVLDIRL